MISRQIAYLSHASFDGPAVQQRLNSASVVIVGTGAIVEHAAAGIETAGVGSLRCVGSVSDVADNPSCMLACPDTSDPELLDAANAAALRNGWNWIGGRIEWGCGLIGPAVLPRQTACYRCFSLRREANLPLSQSTPTSDWGSMGPLAACVGSLLALEALRLMSGVTRPQTLGRVLRVDFFAPEMTSSRVLRLPSCPACGYGKRRLPQISQPGT